MRGWISCLAAVLLAAFQVQATPVRASLKVEPSASPGCPDQADLAEAVSVRLGRNPFVATNSDMDISVRYQKAESWQALVHLSTASGHSLGVREISTDAANCAALRDPIALVVALLVDVSVDELPPEPEPVAGKPARPKKRSLRIPAPTPKDPSLRVLWAVSASASAGLLPNLAVGAQAGVWIAPSDSIAVGLGLQFWPSQRDELAGRPAGVDIRADALAAELCGPRLDLNSLWLRPCLVQRFSRLSASAFGFDSNRESGRLALSTGLGGHMFVPLLGSFGAFSSVSADVHWLRDRFVYARSDGTRGELHRPAPIAGFLQVGLGLSF